jgi:hypothetical protein
MATSAQAQAAAQAQVMSYYTLNNKNYITSFPTTYFPLKKGTGHECTNCIYYASIGDVLIGFCKNCSELYNCHFVELSNPWDLQFGNHITDIEIETIKSLLFSENITQIDEPYCAWLSDSDSDADADADSETYHELHA